MTIVTTVGTPTLLSLTLADGREDLYPQAKIYEAASSVVLDTIDLSHMAQGRYEAEWAPIAIGTYTFVYSVFSDVDRTIELTPLAYSRETEQVLVTRFGTDDLATLLFRVLGLLHENAFIDNTVFDEHSQLLTARVRVFETKACAQSATRGGAETDGLVATYNIESEYEKMGRLSQYRMVKDE